MQGGLPDNGYLMRPGYAVVTPHPHIVYGVLGSGIFVALWDEKKQYSGCCMFQYARSANRKSGLFGDVAIPKLVKTMEEEGSSLSDLRAHMVGGGINGNSSCGGDNTTVAEEILQRYQIEIITRDTGGKLGRKFVYHTETGESVCMKVHKIRKRDWYPYY